MASNSPISVNFFALVQEDLVRVEELMRSQADEHQPDLNAALQHLLSSGGKRVRPAVALLSGRMLHGDWERLVTLSAAIELLHTATLVHDDLIDGSFLRRGIATLNSQWSPAATVLTGDYIFARAARLAAATDSVEVMRLFAETLATIVSGEITQLFSGRGNISRENYNQRIYAKTASMFELAAAAAALLSPVGPELVETMRGYGYSIGMAFQIVDDILDFTGEQATVGKPVASDLRQGLITLPALLYLNDFPDDRDMNQILDGNHIEEVVINRLISNIRESGAIHRALQEAERYVQRGLELLSVFPENSERQALEDLARYFVSRQF
ncbi:MAG: polyprenyl synthetase family protein [Anaerolineales bacterium]|nr:polyprenyl synthetase family protein [Anaerolineales bacterium]